MRRKNLAPSVRDYHSLHWLLYVYLQQGRYKEAEELLAMMMKTKSESAYDNKLRPRYYETIYASMAAAFIVETERWELAAKYFPEVAIPDQTAATPSAAGSHGHGGGQTAASGDYVVRSANPAQRIPLFIRDLANAFAGSEEKGVRVVDAKGGSSGDPQEIIGGLEVEAVIASRNRNYDKAATIMQEATVLEEAMRSPSGPPGLIKPSHELYGELMLEAGRPDVAKDQFRIALLRQPNRARSLLGAARAAARSGDERAAATFYSKLLEQWQEADEGLPEKREAQEFLKQLRR
jgi:pentatricopeptide repeat protein